MCTLKKENRNILTQSLEAAKERRKGLAQSRGDAERKGK